MNRGAVGGCPDSRAPITCATTATELLVEIYFLMWHGCRVLLRKHANPHLQGNDGPITLTGCAVIHLKVSGPL